MRPQFMRAGPIGKTARLVLGVCLVIIALPVYFEAGMAYNLASLGLTAALVFYTALHLVMSRLLASLNRWVGAFVAVTPVFLMW